MNVFHSFFDSPMREFSQAYPIKLDIEAAHRVNFRGQFQALMQALAFNFKRLIKVATMPIKFVPA